VAVEPRDFSFLAVSVHRGAARRVDRTSRFMFPGAAAAYFVFAEAAFNRFATSAQRC
jgi:hypothetical protein